MSSTFTRLNYHIVFSTKFRRPLITENLRDELYSYIGGILRANKGCLYEIGGIREPCSSARRGFANRFRIGHDPIDKSKFLKMGE